MAVNPDSLTVAVCPPVSRPPDVIGSPDVITRTASIIRPIANLDRDGAWGGDIARGTGITGSVWATRVTGSVWATRVTGSVWAITRVTGCVCRRPRGRTGGRNVLRGCRRCHSGWFRGAANEEKWGERQYINTYFHIRLLAIDSFCTRRLALFESTSTRALPAMWTYIQDMIVDSTKSPNHAMQTDVHSAA
jgi:hypothetical protein